MIGPILFNQASCSYFEVPAKISCFTPNAKLNKNNKERERERETERGGEREGKKKKCTICYIIQCYRKKEHVPLEGKEE